MECGDDARSAAAEEPRGEERRKRVVEHRHVGQPAAEHDDVGIEDVDDTGECARHPRFVPREGGGGSRFAACGALDDLARIDLAALKGPPHICSFNVPRPFDVARDIIDVARPFQARARFIIAHQPGS